jgi:hypothetical protein
MIFKTKQRQFVELQGHCSAACSSSESVIVASLPRQSHPGFASQLPITIKSLCPSF